jgi:hypothetical protein
MNLIKSMLIPAALALSLVSSESHAQETKIFEHTEVRALKYTATRMCEEFQNGWGIWYLQFSKWVKDWKSDNPGTYGPTGRTTSIEKKGTGQWRCRMRMYFTYTPR